MSSTEMTAEEAAGSLNYFEQQTMKQKWGVELKDAEERSLEVLYALIAVTEARKPKGEGLDMNGVKSLSIKDVRSWFAENDHDPDSDQGKGSTSPE